MDAVHLVIGIAFFVVTAAIVEYLFPRSEP
jgi:hypothetical protein